MNRNWKFQNNNEGDVDDVPKIIALEKSQIDSTPQGNKIYFYSDVNVESIFNLNKNIDELTKQMKIIEFIYNLPQSPRIELHICSNGGDIFSCMATIDKILSNPVPIDTYCEGVTASAATLISSVGSRRYITKNSCMLVHQVSSEFWGNYMQFNDEIKNMELLMTLIKGVYLKKTKFDPKELDEILSHDLFMDSKTCLKYGLVDEIL